MFLELADEGRGTMANVRRILMKQFVFDTRICERLGARPRPPTGSDKVGMALATLADSPLHGLRHAPGEGTCGWYIWGVEVESDKQDANFFSPLHVAHLHEVCPAVLPYLTLPPGWRFLIAAGHEDVWEDPELAGLSG